MSLPSPFEARLNTNYTPSHTEIPIIKSIINDRKAKAEALTLTIKEMELALQAIRDEQVAYLKEMEDHNTLLAPIRQMPFDILSSIFQAVERESKEPISPAHPSAVLSRVCRDWRLIALDSPSLWTKLRISIPNCGPEALKKVGGELGWVCMMTGLADAILLWTVRSGSLPLTVLAQSDFLYEDYRGDIALIDDIYQGLMGAIKQSCSRWRRVSFWLVIAPYSASMHDLMAIPSTELPLLEEVELNVDYLDTRLRRSLGPRLHGVFTSPGGLLSTVSLQTMKLEGALGDISSTSVTKYWPPITTLDFRVLHPSQDPSPASSASILLQLLQEIPSLQRVSFYNRGKRLTLAQRFPTTPTPLSAPNLASLSLRGESIPVGFAQSLDLPSLRDLSLKFVWRLTPLNINSGFGEFVLRFGPKLTSLSFTPNYVTRRALTTIFESLPGLITLTLLPRKATESHSPHSSRFLGIDAYSVVELNDGTHDANDGMIIQPLRCPRLRRFRLETTSEQYTDDAVERVLVDFIASRRRGLGSSGEHSLEEVTVVFWKQRRPGDPDVLRRLTDDGVDLVGFS